MNKNRSKFFKLIYESKKSLKEENKIINDSLYEFNNFQNIFKSNENNEMNERLIIFILKNIQDKDLINEIKVLNEIFNESKMINSEKIIKDLLLISKKYIFEIINGLKSFIDIVNSKKTEYYKIINDILINKDDNINIQEIHNYINDLNKLNINVGDYENNEYIKLLIILNKEQDML